MYGCIVADEFSRTAEPGVYAIGDVAGPPMLAHKAEHEGVICIEKIAGLSPHPLNKNQIPGCTYCSPEVASVGLTEAEAVARGHVVLTGRYDLAALGKASILNEPQGFVKIVADAETRRPLGVHLVGAHATDLIAEACAVLGSELDLETWGRIVHPHPTLSEAVVEAVQATLGEGVHG